MTCHTSRYNSAVRAHWDRSHGQGNQQWEERLQAVGSERWVKNSALLLTSCVPLGEIVELPWNGFRISEMEKMISLFLCKVNGTGHIYNMIDEDTIISLTRVRWSSSKFVYLCFSSTCHLECAQNCQINNRIKQGESLSLHGVRATPS